jgi:DNA-binding YbaB/EbfC family protein
MADTPDLNALLQQAMAMQQQLLAAQEQAAHTNVEGSAGGGLVKVVLTGAGEPVEVHIEREAVDPDDLSELEDLVLAALRDALARVQELGQAALGDVAGLAGLGGGGEGGGPPGLPGLGGLGGLLGQG